MIERVHGIDRHKRFSTISVLNRQGEEVQFEGACRDLRKYVEGLAAGDAGDDGTRRSDCIAGWVVAGLVKAGNSSIVCS